MNALMRVVVNRLREKSTYVGLALVLGSVGYNAADLAWWNDAVQLVMAIAGLAGMALPDPDRTIAKQVVAEALAHEPVQAAPANDVVRAAGKVLVALLMVGALALPLGACGTIAQIQATAAKAEANSKPRERVAALADALKVVKEGLGAERAAGRLAVAEFLDTEGPVNRATAALDQAGALLASAGEDRRLGDSATDTATKTRYRAQEAGKVALALRKADEAEADVGPLRELYARVRGLPVVVPAS